MIIIILGCLAFLCLTLATLSAGSNKPGLCHSLIGASIAFSISYIMMHSFVGSYYSIPSAIDVYQGKTTLEYTIRDGEIVDSVVVLIISDYDT